MKKSSASLLGCLLAIVFSLIFNQSNGQDFFAVYQNKDVPYYLSKKRIVLKFRTVPQRNKIDSIVSEDAKMIKSLDVKGSNGYVMMEMDTSQADRERIKNLIQKWGKRNSEFVTPVLENKNGKIVGGLTNIFVVRLKNKNDFDLLMKYSNSFRIKNIRQYEFDKNVYFLTVSQDSDLNSIEVSYRFAKSGLFDFAEPEYLTFNSFGTNDPAFNSQYALSKTNGMDVVDAWQLTTGCSAVRVAVLDNGVDLNHPDLKANLLPGFDATLNGSNGGPTGDAYHGTACAGIVGALGNNGIGVAGVAYSCKIVPVRVGEADFFLNTNTAAGIDWVVANNAADIITFSAGGGPQDQLLTNAINNATTNGRQGLGIPFISITQNDGVGTIAYPASLPNAIAVGSIDSNGTRASTSNYGAGLDVVAPGVCVYTTDLVGAAGRTSTDYWTCFSGTSAAAPQVAGVMALILSANPKLTLSQARQILESNTDKLSSYSFSSNTAGQPNGTWNNEVGYGRVNAYKAVLAAIGGPITGPSTICTSSLFSYPNPPSGTVVTWASSNTSALTINSNGLATRVNNYSGLVTITASLTICNSTQPFTKTIRVGTYSHADYSIIESRMPVSGGTQYLYGLGSWMINDASASYNWSWRNYNYVSGQGTRVVNLKPMGTNGGYVGLSISNACGWSDPAPMQFFPYVAPFSLIASPNPVAANTQINVKVMSLTDTVGITSREYGIPVILADDDNENDHRKTTASLFDFSTGNLVKQWTYDGREKNYALHINGVKPGTYVLKIGRDGWSETSKIIVE